jgi:hypothetical protein
MNPVLIAGIILTVLGVGEKYVTIGVGILLICAAVFFHIS